MNPLIPASVITTLQGIDERAMPDTATITLRTRVPDGGGATTELTSTATAACRLDIGGGDEQDEDQVRQFGRHRAYFPVGTTIPPTALITVRGRTFAVTYVWPLTGYSTNRTIGLEDFHAQAVSALLLDSNGAALLDSAGGFMTA